MLVFFRPRRGLQRGKFYPDKVVALSLEDTDARIQMIRRNTEREKTAIARPKHLEIQPISSLFGFGNAENLMIGRSLD